MRLEQSNFQSESTMTGETVTMSIAPEDMGHIMGVLSDLYSDRLAAIVREYSTNAYDEHVTAGVSLPIEVTLPTGLENLLTIRDYGTGLDAEGIRTVYSQYGRSTKRDSNDVNGMLGLGSKSALTYGNQFMVVSVKDGHKITVLVSRNDDGAGEMTILGDPIPTDEASGTAIQIAINLADRQRIAQVAADFFKYWEPGRVLVNGQAPDYFADAENMLQVTPTIYVTHSGYSKNDRVVMGNVSYPVTFPTISRRYSIIALTEIGTVRPTPSREGLMDVPLTNATLAKIGAAAERSITAAAVEQIESAPSGFEAIKYRNDWAVLGVRPSVQYRGQDIPDNISLPPGTKAYRGTKALETTHNFRSTQQCPAHVWDRTLFVENFDVVSGATIQHKRKVLQFCEDNSIDLAEVGTITMLPTAPSRTWVDSARVLDWSKVRATKLPRGSRSTSQKDKVGSYSCRMPTTGWTELDASEIDADFPVVYLPTTEDYHKSNAIAAAASTVSDKWTLVKMPGNRLDKFRRLFPKALSSADLLRKTCKADLDALTADERLAYVYARAGLTLRLLRFDADKIRDPQLAKAVRLAEIPVEKIVSLVHLATPVLGPDALGTFPQATDPLAAYPLLADPHTLRNNAEHTYFYINALYEARQNGLAI